MRLTALIVSGCALLSLSALAAEPGQIRPGQWDLTLKMNIAGMPQLTPAQVAQMKQLGIQVPVGGQSMTSGQCIAPEQASLDNAVANFKGQNGCSIQNYKRVGNRATGNLICSQGKGTFDMQLDSPTAYHGRYTMSGGSMNQTGELTGKWRKDQCDPGVPTYGR
ncbi:DUF3617 domain-containing protein [Pseudomonas sp. RIT-PI-AD]|uniref:DUF3617 domain-containing protein n=1 Tax=Pseudomonas sp. RIT-PI-AD TaxID=3035294 RepID=UPI0021D9DA16|nr:DUF3617 domain-containing protein [Pseudomonas sp. RIT-PI-AD]